MNANGRIDIKKPTEMAPAELKAIEDLITAGGEVPKRAVHLGLPKAELVAVIQFGNHIKAAAVIKNPTVSHRRTVSTESGYKLSDRHRELGYIVVHSSSRHTGLGRLVTESLLAKQDSPLFATTRVDNSAIHKILKKNGFRRVGKEWASGARDAKLILWTKDL